MEFEIAIVGAGVVGLTAALSMQARGYKVAVFEARSAEQIKQASSRVYALNASTLSCLAAIKTLSLLPEKALTPYSQMQVWVANSEAKIDFDSRLLGQSQLGAIAPETPLLETLLKQCQAVPGIDLFTQTPIHALEQTPEYINLIHEKQIFKTQLLLIADGARSALRTLLEVPMTQWSYRQEALVATVQTQNPHANTCYQIFTPTGPLAFLPCHDSNQASIVWSCPPEQAQKLLALSEADFNEALTQAFEGKLGQVHRQTPLSHFPLTMRHVKQYTGNRWLLMGDAAHTIHPMTGLGLNLGLADLTTWLKCFDAHGFKRLKTAMGAYQRERKTQVWKIIALLDGLKFLFNEPAMPIATLRDIGLKAFDNLPPLKRFLIEQAQMSG